MLMVEEAYLPLTITVPGITDEKFQELCERSELLISKEFEINPVCKPT